MNTPARSHALVPTDGRALAYFHVAERTGGVVGVLEDASGGGRAAMKLAETLEEIRIFGDALELIGSVAGTYEIVNNQLVDMPPSGAIASYGQWTARLRGIATLAVAIMDTSTLSESHRRAMARLACSAARALDARVELDSRTEAIGPLESDSHPMLATPIATMTKSHPLSCSF